MAILEYFTDICDILRAFGTFCVHLVHFSGFGTMRQEKSGSPAAKRLSKIRQTETKGEKNAKEGWMDAHTNLAQSRHHVAGENISRIARFFLVQHTKNIPNYH
jgi:hypothetical protein